MYIHRDRAVYQPDGEDQPVIHGPRQSAVSAYDRLKARDQHFQQPQYDDQWGYARIQPHDGPLGMLPSVAFAGDALKHAQQLLKDADLRELLGLTDITLRDGGVTVLPKLGYRVNFKQVVKTKGKRRSVNARGGSVQVFMRANGVIFQINSTLRFGKKPDKLGQLLSRYQIVKSALNTHAEQVANLLVDDTTDPIVKNAIIKSIKSSCVRTQTSLVLSSHNDEFNPMYEVTIDSCKPDPRSWKYLVDATTGKVVFGRNLQHRGRSNATLAAGDAKVRTFLNIPDPTKPLDPQVHDHLVKSLPDKTKLATERFIVKVKKNRKWVVLTAKEDGTFNYPLDTVEFAGVCVAVALIEQDEYYESLGAPKGKDTFTVFAHDENVSDNAYEDWSNKEIHIGKGSGSNRGGLTVWISYDRGVSHHENGHRWVGILTVDSDLGGQQGAGAHEGWAGDVLGTLVMEVKSRIDYATQLGRKLTVGELKKDRFVIGSFALPPDGIRILNNTKLYPGDLTGEPHADGEIIGGIGGDLLKAILCDGKADSDEVTLADLDEAATLFIHSLILAPAHKVQFADLGTNVLTADAQLYTGKHRQKAVAAFKRHGVKIGNSLDGGNGSGQSSDAPILKI
jgi:Zn-dependent metalloprotease